MSFFSAVELVPRDPILGLNEAFNADTRSTEVSLGTSVYFTDEGKTPVLRAVQEIEKARLAAAAPRGYLPIKGIAAYDQAVQKLLFGADSPFITEGRVVTARAPGGTSALKIGADFLKRLYSNAKVAISDPSWENHRVLFESAGFEVVNYTYYDAPSHGLSFAGMVDSLNNYAPNTIVVLHACCRNPTGVDMTTERWKQVVEVIKAKSLIPFLDMAYQGFADDIQQDGLTVRLFAESGLPFFISSSFPKSFSLYGERAGTLSIVTTSKDEVTRMLPQVKRVIRTNYSNPPTHGGTIVASVLTSPELYAMWDQGLGEMRNRIKPMRNALVDKLAAKGVKTDFSFVKAQRGMFSYSGLTSTQVGRPCTEHGIYVVSTGRICAVALNTHNIDAVVNVIADML